MRKQIMFILMLATASQLSAQQTDSISSGVSNARSEAGKISFGVKLSPSINWIRAVNDDVQSDGATLKFGVGAVVAYHLSKELSFVSGLNYNEFGGYVYDNASQNNPNTENNYLINYAEIEVPIALKLQTKPVNKISYYLQGGLSLGFVGKANERYKGIVENTDSISDIQDLTYPNRISYNVGAGMEYSVGKRAVVFGQITYKDAITNSAKSNKYFAERPYGAPFQLLPGSMEFTVGFMF